MRNRLIIKCLFFIVLVIAGGCRKTRNESVTVLRDCTGVYLQYKNKDYHVCNLEKVSSFADGSEVKATFKKIRTCNGSANDQIVCTTLHENEGWIEILKIE